MQTNQEKCRSKAKREKSSTYINFQYKISILRQFYEISR